MSKGWDALMSGCVKQKETVVNGRAGDVCTDTCGLRGGCQHTVRGSTFHIKRKDLRSFSQISTGYCKVKL